MLSIFVLAEVGHEQGFARYFDLGSRDTSQPKRSHRIPVRLILVPAVATILLFVLARAPINAAWFGAHAVSHLLRPGSRHELLCLALKGQVQSYSVRLLLALALLHFMLPLLERGRFQSLDGSIVCGALGLSAKPSVDGHQSARGDLRPVAVTQALHEVRKQVRLI